MSDNPYQAPLSAVEENTALPDSFTKGKLTSKKLNQTAWVAVFALIFSIPVLAITMYAEYSKDEQLKTAGIIVSIISVLIWIYLVLVFRAFIESRFTHVKFALITYVAIVTSVISVIVPIFMGEPEVEDLTAYFLYSAALLMPSGIVTLIYGIKIIRIKSGYPYLVPLGWLNIASGICMLTVILFLFAIPIGLVSEVFLILLFFYASRELRSHSD